MAAGLRPDPGRRHRPRRHGVVGAGTRCRPRGRRAGRRYVLHLVPRPPRDLGTVRRVAGMAVHPPHPLPLGLARPARGRRRPRPRRPPRHPCAAAVVGPSRAPRRPAHRAALPRHHHRAPRSGCRRVAHRVPRPGGPRPASSPARMGLAAGDMRRHPARPHRATDEHRHREQRGGPHRCTSVAARTAPRGGCACSGATSWWPARPARASPASSPPCWWRSPRPSRRGWCD